MTVSWSAQLSRKFNVHLPPDLADWFDHERWQMEAGTSFNQPIDPAELLDPHSYATWGGQMLPDTLPVLSDGGSRTLCLRFGRDGTLAEVVLWNHEGGGWRPYGGTLAEAILLDAATNLAWDSVKDLTTPDIDSQGLVGWALQWVRTADKPGLSLSSLLELGLAEVAVRQELCQQYWTSELLRKCQQTGGQQVARAVGAEWTELRKWLFDTQLMPPEYQEPLSLLTQTPASQLLHQDWLSAAHEAEKVLSRRTDLAWPYAVLGWANERRGELEAAAGYYIAGLETLGTSEGFTDAWHQRAGAQYKFVAERLLELGPTISSALAEHPYLSALTANRNPALGLREYWFAKGQVAEQQKLYEQAYYYYYRAGWDMLLTNEMDDILSALERAASQGQYVALAQLASHHRQSCQ